MSNKNRLLAALFIPILILTAFSLTISCAGNDDDDPSYPTLDDFVGTWSEEDEAMPIVLTISNAGLPAFISSWGDTSGLVEVDAGSASFSSFGECVYDSEAHTLTMNPDYERAEVFHPTDVAEGSYLGEWASASGTMIVEGSTEGGTFTYETPIFSLEGTWQPQDGSETVFDVEFFYGTATLNDARDTMTLDAYHSAVPLVLIKQVEL